MTSLHAEDRSLPSSQPGFSQLHHCLSIFAFIIIRAALTLVYRRHMHSKHRIEIAKVFLSEGDSNQKYLFRVNNFYHTMCVSTISINTFDGTLSFSNQKMLSRRNCEMCHFPGFCALKLQIFFFIKSYALFFLHFFNFLRWTWTLRSKFRRLFVFFWAFWMCLSIVDMNNSAPFSWLSHFPPTNKAGWAFTVNCSGIILFMSHIYSY